MFTTQFIIKQAQMDSHVFYTSAVDAIKCWKQSRCQLGITRYNEGAGDSPSFMQDFSM
jgi:hypothetical protein